MSADTECEVIFQEGQKYQLRAIKLVVCLRSALHELHSSQLANSKVTVTKENHVKSSGKALPPLSRVGLNLNPIVDEMKYMVDGFQKVQVKLQCVSGRRELCSGVQWYKVLHIRGQLEQSQITICFLVHQVILAILRELSRASMAAVENSHSHLESVFKLATMYNGTLSEGGGTDNGISREVSGGIGGSLGSKISHNISSLRKNTCPTLMYPLRRLSLTKIFQTIAQHRAELGSHQLIEALLKNYVFPDLGHVPDDAVWMKVPGLINLGKSVSPDEERKTEKLGVSAQDSDSTGECTDYSHASSLEISRDLTRYVTPPAQSHMPPVERPDSATSGYETKNHKDKSVRLKLKLLDSFMQSEESYIRMLLCIAANVSELVGLGGVKRSKTGEMRVTRNVRTKVLSYYQEVLWGEVGTFIDHVFLWWKQLPDELPLLGTLSAETCLNLRNWLQDIANIKGCLPSIVVPAIQSLVDGIGCHVTTVSWDQQFRKTLVESNYSRCLLLGTGMCDGTETGQLFMEVLRSLVVLANQCERGENIEELPLVEQIPVLHRLDHTVHMNRLWVVKRAKQVVNTWTVSVFFLITQTDVNKSLEVLDQLQLLDREEQVDMESVHVTVCAKMRTKLVSEVRANIDKLKKQPDECVAGMAQVCRTVCLANLHMCMPNPKYWRGSGPLPEFASPYVEEYIDTVLRPVLSAVGHLRVRVQQNVAGMVLRLLCEAWLDHIYQQKIKFSEWGALQLLADFGAVATWLQERVVLSPEVQRHLLKTEVLRRCEGVGRLLLRRPGESIGMVLARNQVGPTGSQTGSPQSTGLDAMPAEMYVPNQEQWLELRARPRSLFICSSCCT